MAGTLQTVTAHQLRLGRAAKKEAEMTTDPRKAAEEFVRSCLAISYGTAEEGIAKIGTLRFEQVVDKVLKALPSEK